MKGLGKGRIGEERVIDWRTSGLLADMEIKVKLRFQNSFARLGKRCTGCGYNHKEGIWAGNASRVDGCGNPDAFVLAVCPQCGLEHAVR